MCTNILLNNNPSMKFESPMTLVLLIFFIDLDIFSIYSVLHWFWNSNLIKNVFLSGKPLNFLFSEYDNDKNKCWVPLIQLFSEFLFYNPPLWYEIDSLLCCESHKKGGEKIMVSQDHIRCSVKSKPNLDGNI